MIDSLANQPTQSKNIVLENLIVSQLANLFPAFMEPEDSLPFTQKLAIGPCSEPFEFSIHTHTLLL
jgi:hypothetical protein